MNRWEQLMAGYGRQHRHPVNIGIHLFCVPVIVATTLVPAAFVPLGSGATAAHVLAVIVWVMWFRLDRFFALAMVPLLVVEVIAAHQLAAMGFADGGGLALVLWIVGWLLQFAGHAIEGRRPALVDDGVIALFSAPLFVVAELCRFAGLRRDFFARVDALVVEADTKAG